MNLHHSMLASPFIVALLACTLAQGPSTKRKPATTVSPQGQVVTEIDPRIWVIYQGRNGDYWFGSNGNGAYRYDSKRVTNYTRADGLTGEQVRDIQEDANGNVFISTTEGVAKFDGKNFIALEIIEASPNGDEWVLDPSDLWFVLDPGSMGPCRYDGERLYHLPLTKSPAEDEHRAKFPDSTFSHSGVYSIHKDRRGHLWFGTGSVGLCRFDGESLSWMYEERLTTTPSGGAFGIRSIYEDRAGDFWITNTRQRFEVSPEVLPKDGYNLIQYERKKGLPDAESDTDENFAYYPSMTEDDAGRLWMACGSDGVWSYDGEEITRYAVGDGAYAFTILCDQVGKLWVGTGEQGIYTFESDGFERFRPQGSSK